MFPNARNMVIKGGTFTVQGGDGRRLAMELLQQYIAPGAFHNSDERYDPPKCHPHTRRAVLKKIEDWVKDADKIALFLWLYGPAGTGKSAIAQTIAELLENAGLLAAAFFFSRNAAGRNEKTPLVATLVYQLIISIPEIRTYVLEALEQDPALFSRSIQAQIQALIIKPLNAVAIDETLAPILLSRPRLIILDGLDECQTTSAQTHILNSLSTAVQHLHIPLFFLIASRPEQHIREAFNDQSHSLGFLSFSIALDDTYQPNRDIQVFLQSKFDEIKRKHPSRAHFPTSWPSSEDIRHLVEKSSGQFIFASTVAKYLNSYRHWPPDRLKIIFGQSKPGQETPFAELDGLYHLILSSVANIERVKDVLMFLVLHPFQGEERYTTTSIERFLFYRPGEIDMILSDLHSIIYVPPSGDGFSELRFFHASLSDFLQDRSRSMDLFLNQGAAYAKITGLAVKHINHPTKSPLGNNHSLIHHTFRLCCVKAHLSPNLLKDSCELNLSTHFKDTSAMRLAVTIPELICWFARQRLSPDGRETLLDHHLAAIDEWLLQTQFLPLVSASSLPHYLAVITLLDQLDPEEYDYQMFSVILKDSLSIMRIISIGHTSREAVNLFHRTESQIEFLPIVCNFLMDRERAGSLWVNSKMYAGLAKHLMDFLRDKRFTCITDVHTQIPFKEREVLHNALASREKRREVHVLRRMTCWEVGKLAFNLLPILLSRIKALGGSNVHEVMVFLRSYPSFDFIKNDPLELEKVKAAQAIEEFLKESGAFVDLNTSNLIRNLGKSSSYHQRAM